MDSSDAIGLWILTAALSYAVFELIRRIDSMEEDIQLLHEEPDLYKAKRALAGRRRVSRETEKP